MIYLPASLLVDLHGVLGLAHVGAGRVIDIEEVAKTVNSSFSALVEHHMVLEEGGVSTTQVHDVPRLQLLPQLTVKVAEDRRRMVGHQALSEYLPILELLGGILTEDDNLEFDALLLRPQLSDAILYMPAVDILVGDGDLMRVVPMRLNLMRFHY